MSLSEPVYTDFEPIPLDNQAQPPLGAPEGNYKGSNVNDTFRFVMAVIRRLGDAVVLLSGDVFTAANRRLSNLAAATLRGDAVNLGQLQDGVGAWCGTSTGTPNAQILTPSPALTGGYRAGQRFTCVIGPGLTNTTAMTFNVSGNGLVAVRHKSGAIPSGGAVAADSIMTFVHDGTNLRIVDGAANYMPQRLYDLLWPLDGPCQIRPDTVDPNTQLPDGVLATWTRIATDEYLRIASGALGTGGSLNTGAGGDHSHGGVTGSNSSNVGQTGSGRSGLAAGHPHTHSISASGTHTHTILPTFRSFAVWRRTS